MPRVVGTADRFLIGDRGWRALYGAARLDAASDGAPRAQLLVRPVGESMRAALYYPDALVRHLERHDPRHGIDDGNIDAFSVFVEELDHLLVLASRAAAGRPVTLLELEHHAAVTKYLVVMHFLGRLTRRRVSEFHRVWVRHRLFERYAGGEGEDCTRYREAARWAGRYVRIVERLSVERRLSELRAFHRRSFAEQTRGVMERG